MRQLEASRSLAYVLTVLPPLFWSGNFVVARLMRDSAPPVQLSLWRWVAAALLILPWAVADVRREWPRVRGNIPFLALLSLVGVTAFNCLIYAALHHTTVVNAALVNSLMPIATFALAYVLLGDRLRRRQLLGVAISLAGAVVVVTRGEPARILTLGLNFGDLLVFVGLSCWALYTTLVRWRPPGLRPLALLAVTFTLGALFHLPFAAVEFATLGGPDPTLGLIAALAYLAIFPSILAYVIWNRSVATLGPGQTGMFMHLMPLFSAALAIAFLGESLGSYHLLGFVLVSGGILLVTRTPSVTRPVDGPRQPLKSARMRAAGRSGRSAN